MLLLSNLQSKNQKKEEEYKKQIKEIEAVTAFMNGKKSLSG